ncbi:MAG: transposase [Actinomycetota bacterium]|nr:transposase [Actinomycetota bacterium]
MALGETGYPAIQLMTLVETGTRALIGAEFGTGADGEITWARRLLHHLDESMLVLADRGFDAADFLAEVADTGAQFLVRLKSTRRPPVIQRLPDGSDLVLIGGMKVRIITAHVSVTCHDGTTYGDDYRLATTLTDHRAYPDKALIGLYHERWEHEITYLALRHTLLQGPVLRSGDRAGLEQEMWALLAVYQALRTTITDAIATVDGTDPDRASYQLAVTTAQNLVIGTENVVAETVDLAGEIGRAVLANLNPPRRPRVCARRVKSPLSRWNKHPPAKPRTNLRITRLTITANDHAPQRENPTRHSRSLTHDPEP